VQTLPAAETTVRQGRNLKKPRVGILSTWHPEPVDNGSKQRLRHIIDALSTDNTVVFVTMVAETDLGPPLADIPGVEEQRNVTYPSYRPRAIRGLAGALSLLPRSLNATWNRRSAEAIQRFLLDADVDVVIGADPLVLRYLLHLSGSFPLILDEANFSPFLETLNNSLLQRARSSLRTRKYRSLVDQTADHLDLVITPSEVEAAAFRRLSGSGRVAVLGNAVGSIPEDPWKPNDSTVLLFTGSITYGPNARGVSFFATEVMPLVTKVVLDAELVVTGQLPLEVPADLTHRRVRFTGLLDSLEDIYRSSGLFVVPLLEGHGTRTKILEAMAHGIPVVSTSKGAEGLDVVDGQHLIIADDPPRFADAVVRLLNDAELSAAIGDNGRRLVEAHYTWDRHGEQLRQLVRSVLASREVG
jgi:glycosyltransferase involved in cell wall biosynthesis